MKCWTYIKAILLLTWQSNSCLPFAYKHDADVSESNDSAKPEVKNIFKIYLVTQ